MSTVLPGAANVPAGDALELPPPDPERLVILQYTSGSTSEPKGVMIPDRVLTANLDAIGAAAGMAPDDDVMVSWLPLYHDMGLVGFLSLPMTAGLELVQAAPQDFLARPAAWMQWISEHRGTATAGPNFAWVLATRALKRRPGLDLSCLTLALSGAEPVDPAAVDAFVAAADAARLPARRRVPGLRHGRGGDRRLLPPARSRPGVRHGRPRACSSAITSPSRSRSTIPTTWPCRPVGSRCSAGRCPAWRCASSTPTRSSGGPSAMSASC